MASLISASSVDIDGVGKLPAAKLLVMGGDQVYPYPTRKAYRERFEFPYKTALPAASDGSWRRLLFVLPGNHDWYDGLSSFDYMFCKARFGHAAENRIGGWLCPQHRSYFAIRLPHNWWIWGADIQLAQYLDAGQVLYFEGVAEAMKQHPTEAPKLILCTPEPTWNYDKGDTLQGEDNLSQITKIADDAGARICAVLSGDLHHYSRYVAKDGGGGASFFTAGGGGAYFSPTHYLKSVRKFTWLGQDVDLTLRCKIKDGKSTDKPSCWPIARNEPPLEPLDARVPLQELRLCRRLGHLLLADHLVLRHDAARGEQLALPGGGRHPEQGPRFPLVPAHLHRRRRSLRRTTSCWGCCAWACGSCCSSMPTRLRQAGARGRSPPCTGRRTLR